MPPRPCFPASACRAAGRLDEAIPLVRRTLAARERMLGPDHLSTLGARHNLAAAYRAAGRAAEAAGLFEQTLADCERLLGAEHPRTVSTRKHLDLARKEAGEAGG